MRLKLTVDEIENGTVVFDNNGVARGAQILLEQIGYCSSRSYHKNKVGGVVGIVVGPDMEDGNHHLGTNVLLTFKGDECYGILAWR